MTTLVVTDLDGTLWDATLRSHPANLAAVATLMARDDVELLAATGRRRNSARYAYGLNALMLPSVLLNGAVGYDFTTEELFHKVTFEQPSFRDVLSALKTFELGPVAYLSDTRAFAVCGVTTSIDHLDSLGRDLVWSSFDELAPRTDVLGLSMLGIEWAQIEPAVADLEALVGVEVASYPDHLYAPYSLMLAPENVTKELGINVYCQYRDIVPDRIVAVGDAGNDLEMLAMADVALVVRGGDPRALELADHVIERPEHGGWAAVLDHV